jgi:aspartyl/asparaginyl beta-hydroxylase (cupin superfamily)
MADKDSSYYLQAGTEALRRGDARAARDHLQLALEAGRSDAPVLLGLAYASLALHDDELKIAAVERLLTQEPRNTRALMLKADHLASRGDIRGATAFYQGALRSVPPDQPVAAELAPELKRAQQMVERFALQYQEYLQKELRARGFDPATSSARFARSIDLVLGQRRVYVQEPRFYYFPELPQIQFYTREAFPWLDRVEQSTAEIRNELLGVMAQPQLFAPYVQEKANRPHKSQLGMVNNPDWSAFYLIKHGEVVPENAARCPQTLAALRDVPFVRQPGRSPSVLFSVLKAGAHIPAHTGLVNTRLICHLPLIVPGRCTFRVGNEVRDWVEGKAWVFDDTIEHEAWNHSDATRVILLFDIWRPELNESERELVTSLFAAIDEFSGRKPEWTI